MVKVKVLEYHVWRGNIVKVKEFHYKKGKLVLNPKYDWHKTILSRLPSALVVSKKEYEVEMK